MKEILKSKAFWIALSVLAALFFWNYAQSFLACNQYTMGSTNTACHEKGFEAAWAIGLVISLLIAAIISAIASLAWQERHLVKSAPFLITLAMLLLFYALVIFYFGYGQGCPSCALGTPCGGCETIKGLEHIGLNVLAIGAVAAVVVSFAAAKFWQMVIAKKAEL